MVLLDKAQVVEIIDHEACSFAHAFRGGIAEPVQPFQACTIAEMKARDWIHRLATRCFRAEIVESRKAENDWTKRRTRVRVEVPVGIGQLSQGGRVKIFKTGSLWISSNATKPRPKLWCRRQGNKGLQRWQVPRNLLHDMLDQKVAERDAFQTRLAVAD